MIPSSLPADHTSSYELLYDEDIAQGDLGQYGVLDLLYNYFVEITGPMFRPSLTLSRFLLVKERCLRKNLNKTTRADLEIAYKRICGGGTGIDFYRFISAIEWIVRESYNVRANDDEGLNAAMMAFLT